MCWSAGECSQTFAWNSKQWRAGAPWIGSGVLDDKHDASTWVPYLYIASMQQWRHIHWPVSGASELTHAESANHPTHYFQKWNRNLVAFILGYSTCRHSWYYRYYTESRIWLKREIPATTRLELAKPRPVCSVNWPKPLFVSQGCFIV